MSEDLYFSSDTHFGHKSILHLGHGRPFSSVEEMDETMIERWNAMVKPTDRIYHLGDFSFHNPGKTLEVALRLNGRKFFLWGNHDHRAMTKVMECNIFEGVYDYKELKHTFPMASAPRRLVLFHFPIASWHQISKGAWHLHGHCVDDATEILTKDGWKTNSNIWVGDLVATVNAAGSTEWQPIDNIIDVDHTGLVFNISSKSFDGRFTPDHTMILLDKHERPIKVPADKFADLTNRRILQSAPSAQPEIVGLSDNMLRLYIWAVTDGSLENSSLLRFHLRKPRKINRLRGLLDVLNMSFSENRQASGTTKINFTIPDELKSFSIKPLDNMIMSLSQRQADIVVNEYCETDGNWQSATSFQISTSKTSEAHLLQAFLVSHGYRCNLSGRDDGIHDTRWILSGNKRRFATTSRSPDLVRVEEVQNEHFWCVKVANQNFYMRRNGKVHVTGNCHGNLPDTDMARMDIGVDTHEFYPWHIDEIAEVLKDREGLPGDHHGR